MSEVTFPGYHGVWRIARRRHECWHCKELIVGGERYFEYLGDTPSYQSGKRFHGRCAVAHFVDHEPHVRDGGAS